MFEGGKLSACVEDDADGVEAQGVAPRSLGCGVEVGGGDAPDLCTLPKVQAVPWVSPALAAGLDLGEHEHRTVEGDEVELTVAGTEVPRHDGEAETLEVLRGELLAVPAELVSRVGAGSGHERMLDDHLDTAQHRFATTLHSVRHSFAPWRAGVGEGRRATQFRVSFARISSRPRLLS